MVNADFSGARLRESHSLRKILQSFFDEIGGSLIGIAGAVEFHGAVALVVAVFQNAEGLREIGVNEIALFVGFHGLYMANAIGVLEHRFDAFVGVFGLAGHQRIREVRVRVQPGIVHLFDDADDEEWIFAERIVVFEVNENILLRAVLRHSDEAVRGAIEVRLRILGRRHIGTDTRRSDGCGNINPLFAEGDGFFPLGFVRGVGAVLAVDGDVYDGTAGFFENGAKFVQILRIKRTEMLAPWFDLADIEF